MDAAFEAVGRCASRRTASPRRISHRSANEWPSAGKANALKNAAFLGTRLTRKPAPLSDKTCNS